MPKNNELSIIMKLREEEEMNTYFCIGVHPYLILKQRLISPASMSGLWLYPISPTVCLAISSHSYLSRSKS